VSDSPHSRRAFFRQVVKRYVEPAVDYLDKQAPPPTVLRPPGAVPEGEFLSLCERCHACVSACPADAIRPIGQDGPLKGTPGIVAAEQPCVVCTDLDCMPACPTGALQVIGRQQITIGTALVAQDLCVRSKGECCQSCVDLCPLGSRAIQIGADNLIEVLDGCIGCGVCEHVCHTTPKAITVTPNPSRAEPAEVTPRSGVRALVITPEREVLLMKLREPGSGGEFWISPGGGREPGESDTVALARELAEEVGTFDYTIGPAIWRRTSRFTWKDKHYAQEDTFYQVETAWFEPGDGEGLDGCEREAFRGFRWWTLEEMEAATETFFPRRLTTCLRRLFTEGAPDTPYETGM